MKATKELPSGYRQDYALSLRNNTRLLVWINIASIPLLCGFGFFFIFATRVLRPELWQSGNLWELVALHPLALILAFVLMIVLHEVVHGIFFGLYTRSMPTFGFKGAYAFAAAPGWYIPRDQYLVVALAPFVLMTLGGLVLMPMVSFDWFPPLLLLLVFNAAGAIGDFLVVWKVAGYAQDAFVLDLGDGFEIHAPDSDANGEMP